MTWLNPWILRGLLLTVSSGVFPGNGSESEEDYSAGAEGSPVLPGTHRAPDSKLHPGHTKMDAIKKGQAKDSQRYKVTYEAQSTDTQNFSSESERETKHVRAGLCPCGVDRGRGCQVWAPQGTRSPFTQEPRGCAPSSVRGQLPSLLTYRTGT